MGRSDYNARFSLSADERKRIRRSFLAAFVGTPWLLFMESVRRIVSLDATGTAVGLGVFLGSGAAIGLADVDFRTVNNVTASVATLGFIVAGTTAIWLSVPD